MSNNAVIAPVPETIRFDDGRHARAKIGYVLLATGAITALVDNVKSFL